MRDFTQERLKFEPSPDAIVVIYDGKNNKTSSGIIIAGTMADKYPAIGTIVALSKESKEAGYEIGSKIIYHGYMAEDVPVDGVEVDVINTINVLGKILL